MSSSLNTLSTLRIASFSLGILDLTTWISSILFFVTNSSIAFERRSWSLVVCRWIVAFPGFDTFIGLDRLIPSFSRGIVFFNLERVS